MEGMRRILLTVVLSALALQVLSGPTAAGGCVNDARPTEGASPAVRIDKCQFLSALVRVPVGTTVTWTNADFLPHEVSGIGWGRTQSMLLPGDTYSHAFAEAGIFPYFCPLHPGMAAVVFVGDVAAGDAPAVQRPESGWLATALLASLLVGVTGFAAGRYLGR